MPAAGPRPRACWHAAAGHGPLSRELAQAWGIACLKAGDRAGYREACAAVLARQGPDPTVVWDASPRRRSWPSAAEGLDDYRCPIAWFERRLADVPRPNPSVAITISRTHWAGCSSGPAGSTKRSSD